MHQTGGLFMGMRTNNVDRKNMNSVKVKKDHTCENCLTTIKKGTNAHFSIVCPPGDWSQLGFPYRAYLCNECYGDDFTFSKSNK
jgi:hypothetical protein